MRETRSHQTSTLRIAQRRTHAQAVAKVSKVSKATCNTYLLWHHSGGIMIAGEQLISIFGKKLWRTKLLNCLTPNSTFLSPHLKLRQFTNNTHKRDKIHTNETHHYKRMLQFGDQLGMGACATQTGRVGRAAKTTVKGPPTRATHQKTCHIVVADHSTRGTWLWYSSWWRVMTDFTTLTLQTSGTLCMLKSLEH